MRSCMAEHWHCLPQVQVASAAESACLPPNQPVLSEGLCIPSDALWEVGCVLSIFAMYVCPAAHARSSQGGTFLRMDMIHGG